MSKINLEQITNIIAKNIGVKASEVNINSNSNNFYRWDSLTQVTIVLDIEKVIKMYRELINPVRFNILKSNLIWYDDLYNDYYKSIQTIKKLKLNINELQFNKMWDNYLNPSYRLRQDSSDIRAVIVVKIVKLIKMAVLTFLI